MFVRNAIASMHNEMAAWRRSFHEQPGGPYEEHAIRDFALKKLKEWNVDVVTDVGKTGFVAIIEGNQKSDALIKTIAFRGDMDALPLEEKSHPAKPSISKVPGWMHACGHDGHSTILLGAAKYLSENRDFHGRVMLMFQPAEEGYGGADRMIADGLFQTPQLDAHEIYAYHNWPDLPLGQAGLCAGPFFAAADKFTVSVVGKAGHGGKPEDYINPAEANARLTLAFLAIVKGHKDPLTYGVLTTGRSVADSHAFNAVAATGQLEGTVRTYTPERRMEIEAQMRRVCEKIRTKYRYTSVTLNYERMTSDPVVNTPDETAYAAQAMREVLGSENVNADMKPVMTGDDFASMLRHRPGALMLIGGGKDPTHPCTQPLHSEGYDYNDDTTPVAVEWIARMVTNFSNRNKGLKPA